MGEGDAPVGICTWFRMAGLFAGLWIPAFAGMTGREWEKWEKGIRRLGFGLDFGWRAWMQPSGFPLSRE